MMMDRGTVMFYDKNKFEKLVHLFGFIIRIVCIETQNREGKFA